MSVAFDAASGAIASTVTSISWSHTCSGSNRGLVASVAEFPVRGHSATYNSVAMAFEGSQQDPYAADPSEISQYTLIAPSTGANDIVITFDSGTTSVIVGGVSVTGADQSDLARAFVSAQGTDSAPTLSVPTNSDEFVVDAMETWQPSGTQSADAGQTERWKDDTSYSNLDAGGSTKPGSGSSVTMSWTLTGSADWAIAALSIKTGGSVYADSTTEAATAADTNSSSVVFPASAAESATAAEASSNAISIPAAVAESAAAAEASSNVISIPATVDESTAATETQDASTYGLFSESTDESVTAAETQSAGLEATASTTEAASAVDAPDAVTSLDATTSEAATATDTQDGATSIDVASSEAATADSEQEGIPDATYNVATVEAVSVTETQSAAATFEVATSEAAPISDEYSATLIDLVIGAYMTFACHTRTIRVNDLQSRRIVITLSTRSTFIE